MNISKNILKLSKKIGSKFNPLEKQYLSLQIFLDQLHQDAIDCVEHMGDILKTWPNIQHNEIMKELNEINVKILKIVKILKMSRSIRIK